MKITFTISRFFVLFVLTVVMAGNGCQRRLETENKLFTLEQNEFQLTIVIDLSGSFSEQMADDGQAYKFIHMLCDRYFRDRLGTTDRIVIAQISGTKEALLWEGTPLALRKDFPSPKAFRDYLYSNSDAGTSRVYENLAKTLDYVLDRSSTSTSTKKALFILSDMMDNASDPEMGEAKTTDALVEFSKSGGLVGIYFVSQGQVIHWREKLRSAGVTNFCVESEIVSRPNLPSFE